MCRAERGFTLMETIVFIVVMGVALAGLFAALSTSVRGSADPLARKQALAVAEGLLREILLKPFTWCDPDDAHATTAASAADCASLPENPGPEAGETRYSLTSPYDNVNDYHGLDETGVRDLTDPTGATIIPGLEDYRVRVAVSAPAVAFPGVGAGEALQVDVRVTGPGTADASLTGYRFMYAPNATP